jgi:hypothetical protein
MTGTHCSECGAHYSSSTDTCVARFDQLLALDHSRREPWGSRHGQAFAAFALQHPLLFVDSVDAAWAALYRIYCLDTPPTRVFADLRGLHDRTAFDGVVPRRPLVGRALPTVTIADLGDFSAATYPSQLDAWCRATLRAWGSTR